MNKKIAIISQGHIGYSPEITASGNKINTLTSITGSTPVIAEEID